MENRRRYPRVVAPIYYRPARFRSTRVPVVDIGLGGIRIFSDESFKVNDRLNVELFLPQGETLECLVQVVWISTLPEGGPAKYDVGLEILDMPKDMVQRLTQVLDDET